MHAMALNNGANILRHNI